MENRKIKFMCSSGGRILPRPSDLKLRYVGGETRMLSFPRSTDYDDFLSKMVDIYGPDILLRYQLPDEDLDALVTVSSDEDLENMIEECDRLNSKGGSSKLRVFVFSISELDSADLQILPDHKTSEQKFVDAINDAPADRHSAVHKHFRTTEQSACLDVADDSFEAWNKIQMQGRVSPTKKNESSEVFQGDTLEKFYNSANHVPYVHSHINIPTQPAFFDSMAYNDTFNSNLHNMAVGMNNIYDFVDRSLASSQQELKSNLPTNTRISSSSSYLQQKAFVNYENEVDKSKEEDKTYRREHRFAMDPVINAGPLNESDNFGNFLFNDNHFKQSDTKVYRDQFSMSPGVFVQKQPQKNQYQVKYDSVNMDNSQYATTADGFKEQNPQKKVFHEQQGDYNWDSCPLYDSSPASDLACAESSHLDPGYLQLKLNDDIQSRQRIGLEYESTAMESVEDYVNHTVNPMGRHPLDMSLPEFSGCTISDSQDNEKMMKVPWITSVPSHCTVLSSDDGKKMQSQINCQVLLRASDKCTDDIPDYVKPVGHEDDNKRHHISQSSLYIQREQPKDKEVKCAEVNDALSSSFTDYFPTSDMISDLLRSSELVDCLPAKSSTDGNLGSKFAPIGKADSLNDASELDPIETIAKDPTVSDERTIGFSGIKIIHDDLPSKEEIDFIMSATFVDTTSKEMHRQDLLLAGDTMPVAPDTVGHPDLSSLIDSWETSLLMDEHDEAGGAQHQIQGRPLQENTLVFDINKDDSPEDSAIEFEGNDEFKSFDYGTVDPVAAAEAEAIARGLQIIRNIDLEEVRELGSGTFGTVYHGKWRGTDVAIKRIKASCFTGRKVERDRLIVDFWREAYILGQLHHPNVVAFYGIVPDGPGATLATVTEYMVNGSVKQVLQSKDRTLDRRKKLFIAMDAAFGMEYLHSKNVVHFDIKCENLLVNLRDLQRPICKIADLGLSKVKQQTFVSGGVRGTLPWMAPELLNGNSNLVSEKVDVFSFGIVMWELLTGEEPYADMHYGAIIGGIVNNTLRPRVPRWCDLEWKSLMERCWAADPVDRPTFSEIARRLRAMEASTNSEGAWPRNAHAMKMH